MRTKIMKIDKSESNFSRSNCNSKVVSGSDNGSIGKSKCYFGLVSKPPSEFSQNVLRIYVAEGVGSNSISKKSKFSLWEPFLKQRKNMSRKKIFNFYYKSDSNEVHRMVNVLEGEQEEGVLQFYHSINPGLQVK